MTVARHIIAAFLAVSLAWVGSAAPVQAHSHEVSGHHASDPHVVSVDLDHDHGHDHDNDHHHEANAPPHDEQVPHDHEKGIFHVHTMTLVAVETAVPSLAQVSTIGGVDLPVLVVPLHTRSITPADRPPRTFL